MADSALNYFVARGTNAERVAFTPVPPTPASGPDPLHIFYETDTGDTFAWDGSAWDQVNTAGATPALDDLTDVDAAAPSDGDVLTWVAADSEWQNVAPSGGGGHRGCLVALAVDAASTNYTGSVAVSFPIAAEVYDTDSIYDSGAPTRLSVPSGVTKVRLKGQMLHSTTGTSGSFNGLSINKNGVAAYPGAPWAMAELTSSVGRVQIASPVLVVVGGTDYFELIYQSETDTSIVLLASYTWFEMEIIE